MDAVGLLKEFAKTQGIESKEVDKFLEQFNSPKTINDVMALPLDMQYHETYVTWLQEPLQSFIMDEWYDGDRYKTLTLDYLVDFLFDRMYYVIEGSDNDDNFDIGDAIIADLKPNKESDKERLDYLKSVAQCIIDIKLGSVGIDW